MNKNEFLKKEIARRNKLFAGKTNAQKRVLIARDVIAQINTEKIIPKKGTWFEFELKNYRIDMKDYTSGRKQILCDDNTQCVCCGVGSLLASCVLFNNKVSTNSLDRIWNIDFDASLDMFDRHSPEIKSGLLDIFSRNQLALIECVFENRTARSYDEYTNRGIPPCPYDEVIKIIRLWKTPADSTERLVAIMKNIIRNRGTFKPLSE